MISVYLNSAQSVNVNLLIWSLANSAQRAVVDNAIATCVCAGVKGAIELTALKTNVLIIMREVKPVSEITRKIVMFILFVVIVILGG